MRIISLLCLALFSLNLNAASLDNISWGLEVKEKIAFEDTHACSNTVTQALKAENFKILKTGFYEQGPTLFAVSADGKQKAVVKCMMDYELVITVVIGEENNLAQARQISEQVLKAKQGKRAQAVSPDAAHLVIVFASKSLEAAREKARALIHAGYAGRIYKNENGFFTAGIALPDQDRAKEVKSRLQELGLAKEDAYLLPAKKAGERVKVSSGDEEG